MIKLNLQMSNVHYKQKNILDTIKFSTISIQNLCAPASYFYIDRITTKQFLQHLTLTNIIELNATTNWPTFWPLWNWHNNLNSVTSQYCKCGFLQGVMGITMETCFNLFLCSSLEMSVFSSLRKIELMTLFCIVCIIVFML